MKVITAKVELTHNGEKITLKGTEAQTALQRLTAWDGQGSVAINYTDPATKQVQGIFMCCGDTWKRLPNEVEEKEEMPCKWCKPLTLVMKKMVLLHQHLFPHQHQTLIYFKRYIYG